jgi:hypothetical protein
MHGTAQELKDQFGNVWKPEAPITIRFAFEDAHQIISNTYMGTVMNAVDTISPLVDPYGWFCPSDSICCPDRTQRYLVRNSRHDYWDMNKAATFAYKVTVSATQGSTVASLLLTPSKPEAELPYLKATTLSAQPVNQFSVLSDMIFVDRIDNVKSEGFHVPRIHVGPSSSQIGIEDSAFLTQVACEHPIGTWTRILGGPVNDQFFKFRSSKISTNHDCTYLPEKSRRNREADDYSSYACAAGYAVHIILELDVKSFKLVKLYGFPQVLDYGNFPIVAGAKLAHVFVDVINYGNEDAVFTVQLARCGEEMVLVGGAGQFLGEDYRVSDPIQKAQRVDETYRFLFTVVSTKAMTEKSGCRYVISQHGREESTGLFNFDKPEDQLTPPNTPGGTTTVVIGGEEYTTAACTVDQTILNDVCLPIVCFDKYGNTKSFYNLTSGLCESVPSCGSGTYYDVTTNQCKSSSGGGNPNINGSSSTESSSSSSSSSCEFFFLCTNEAFGQIDCGEHGEWKEESGNCHCHEGWKTPTTLIAFTNDSMGCSAVDDDGAINSGSTSSNSTDDFRQLFVALGAADPGVVMAILVGCLVGGVALMGGAVMLGVCIGCIRYRQRRRKKSAYIEGLVKESVKSLLTGTSDKNSQALRGENFLQAKVREKALQQNEMHYRRTMETFRTDLYKPRAPVHHSPTVASSQPPSPRREERQGLLQLYRQ